eukprot:2042894-Amphidinium_carterae.1
MLNPSEDVALKIALSCGGAIWHGCLEAGDALITPAACMVLECNCSTDVIGLRMGQVAPHDLRALEQLQASVAECGMGLLTSVQACVDKLSEANLAKP